MVKFLLWVVAPVVLLAILRPWTIRPLGGQKPAVFEAATFAAAAWPRLVGDATQNATTVSEAIGLNATSPVRARFVKGTGLVTAVDRQSRVGLLRVRLSGAGDTTAAIQIGPVMRGTALRDASSFIHFSDFTNQFDYAGAANALNDYALRTVVSALPLDTLPGRTIGFLGAIAKTSPAGNAPMEIAPVQLLLAEASGR
jgi:predicted lipoprotein